MIEKVFINQVDCCQKHLLSKPTSTSWLHYYTDLCYLIELWMLTMTKRVCGSYHSVEKKC